MEPRELLEILKIAERLKDTTRHCYTSKGRHESVAEHSWMMTLMAFLIHEEFPEVDMNRVLQMCLIHDLGECFTGDIPTFNKTKEDEKVEEELLDAWVDSLPKKMSAEMKSLYTEMKKRETPEAKVYKALDNLEALIQHNFSDIHTWSDNEYDLNMTYANDKVTFSDYLTQLRDEIREDSIRKIEKEDCNLGKAYREKWGTNRVNELESPCEMKEMRTDFASQMERVAHMEELYDRIQYALDTNGNRKEELESLKPWIAELQTYYEDGRWLEDFDAEQENLFPTEMKRGILAEDTLYDLFCELDSDYNPE